MNKISYILAIGFIFYTTNSGLIATSQDDFTNNLMQFEEDDDFNFDDSLNFNTDGLRNHIPAPKIRSIATNTDAWALLLITLGDNKIILNQSIYKYTNPLRTRQILDYPFALTYGFDLQDTSALSINFYANASLPKNFTQSSQVLSSYLYTQDSNLINILQDILDENPADDPINVGEAFDLLSPGKVYELRTGWLFEGHIAREKWNLNIQLPIQYVARAFYLTPAERDLIFNSQLASLVESSDDIDQNQFYFDNFYADQFGMGDLKIKAMYQMQQSPHFDVNIGGFIIFPTAKAFKQGIAGAWFEQNNDRAYLDLRQIDPENITTQDLDTVANFFLAAIDKLNSNILYPLLGNNGHVITAFSCNTDWYFAQHWKFCGDYSFEIPLRGYEQRFYKAIQSNGEFITQFNTYADADDSNGLVLFANQKIQDIFFPYVYNTLVWPGIIVNSTNQFVVSHDQWAVQFGSNFWYQAKEIITAPIARENYDIQVVPAASASQGKVFGKFNYNFDCQKNVWCLAAYTDITIWNSGIGNDYTLGLSLDCKF